MLTGQSTSCHDRSFPSSGLATQTEALPAPAFQGLVARAGSGLMVAGRSRPATGPTGRMTETTLYDRLLGIETRLMAHAPIVALVVIKSEWGGKSVAAELASRSA